EIELAGERLHGLVLQPASVLEDAERIAGEAIAVEREDVEEAIGVVGHDRRPRGRRLSALRPELPPADAVKVQVEDRLAGIVARVAGEAVAGRLRAHLAGDPSGDRDQPTERRLVPRLGLAGRGKMLLRDNG